jgi:hypothetical protein
VIDAEDDNLGSVIDELEIVNGFDNQIGVPIHIFKITDLGTIFEKIDTLSDFLEYLSIRQKLICGSRIISYNCELDLMATYLFDYDTIRSVLQTKDDRLLIEPGLWEKCNKDDLEKNYLEHVKSSYGIDEIIDFLHNAVGFKVYDEFSTEFEGSIEGYQKSAYELSCLNRMMRKQMADKLIEKSIKAMKEKFGFAHLIYPEIHSSFLILSFNGNRTDRRMFLNRLCACAYVKLEDIPKEIKCRKVIGIATEPINYKTPSYDVIVLENAEFTNIAEIKADAKKLFA